MSPKLKAFLWRIVYVLIIIIVLIMVWPPLIAALGLSIPAQLFALLKVVLGIIALIYIIFGPDEHALL